jgi:hypothetical protein
LDATESTDRLDNIERMLDDLFDGRVTLSRRQLADGLSMSLDGVKEAMRLGVLAGIRVSPRRWAVSRTAVRRYLIWLEEQAEHAATG